MNESNDQRLQRLKKLETLRGMGVEPYGQRFESKDRAGALIREHGQKTKETLEQQKLDCVLAGRIVGLRRFGKAAFALLQDGADRIQVYCKKDILGDSYRIVEELDLGDWIGVSGTLFRTKTDEFTVEVRALTF
jgi:lysyl-tRNA synthetase class 2